MSKNKWWLNGGRGSGRTIRLLCETYENKIADLERKNAELREKYLQATDEGTSFAHLKSLERENAGLKEEIEKMKCCYNCANDTLEPPEVISNGVCENCINHSKWELQY